MHYKPQARDSHDSISKPRASAGFLQRPAAAVLRGQMLKLSPQPQVPLMFGLLNTNSLDNLSST